MTDEKLLTAEEVEKRSGVHFRHCYHGENEDNCKYGYDNCPAKPQLAKVDKVCPDCEDYNDIEIGTIFKEDLKKCPVCDQKAGWRSVDSMTTMACGNCGARFLQTFYGVEYVKKPDCPTCQGTGKA